MIKVTTERQVEALTVAMLVAPGVYARNRMFDLFRTPGARRAKHRAVILRGILPQLVRASGVTVTRKTFPARAVRANEVAYVLRYVVSAIRLTRVVELSEVELAALRLVAERSNIRCLPTDAGGRALVETTLARLMASEATGRLAGEVTLSGAE